MKKNLITLLLILFSAHSLFAENNSLWQRVDAKYVTSKGTQLLFPSNYLVYSLNIDWLEHQLYSLPYNADKGQLISLPLPDGSFRNFMVWQTHIMESELEAKYPVIKTFTAYAIDDPRVTAKIDYTPRGFHAMIFEPGNVSFIDPYSDLNDGYYLCYYKKDYKRTDGKYMRCGVNDDIRANKFNGATSSTANMRLVNGNVLRTFRMALACTGEYAQAVAGATPTKANVLSAMVTSINRVNGVYERELAITMKLVNNEDTLIFLVPGAYSNNDYSALIAQNQDTIDHRIGSANYDIGHVFSTGGGGFSQLGCVCIPGKKAQSETGALNPVGDAFDIDYVVHEIGHEFNADHSFNDNSSGLCAGNANFEQSYEPGSGSTIMCYAGICTGDNIQPHSDDYFHTISLQIIKEFITIPFIAACPVSSPSGNKPVSLPSFSASYNIPYLTPFELTAPNASDSVGDTLNTYCWEEWDLGDYGKSFANTYLHGPIFRSFSPTTSMTRVFPRISALLHDTTNYLGEKVPDSARMLNFKLTVRDIYQGIGCLNIPDDSIQLHVINTGSGFTVTSPNAAENWYWNSVQLITWNIAGTDMAPINCDSVDIFLSVDSGYTYPLLLRSKAPNTGIAYVTVPEVITDRARIKVKGAGNVFFNINHADITINSGESAALFPVPTKDVLNIRMYNHDPQQLNVYNAIGQSIYKGECTSQCSINVAAWSRGVYYLKMWNTKTNSSSVKPFVVR